MAMISLDPSGLRDLPGLVRRGSEGGDERVALNYNFARSRIGLRRYPSHPPLRPAHLPPASSASAPASSASVMRCATTSPVRRRASVLYSQ